MSAAFYVVATPIGNLGDLSARAQQVLRDADYVLAEDTRRARILLEHIQSPAKMYSCHQHNELTRVKWVLAALAESKSIALISDAGAPSISDPGGRLVAELAEAGCPIEVIPGPSAPIAALMGAGIAATRFVFLGFLPRKAGARKTLLDQVSSEFGVVLFESPHRVEATLASLFDVYGPRKVVVAREITKHFETFHRGRLGAELVPPLQARGEIVIVVESGEAAGEAGSVMLDREQVLQEVLGQTGLKPRERAKRLAKELGLSTRDAYALVQQDDERQSVPSTSGAEDGPGSTSADAAPPSLARDHAAAPFSTAMTQIRARVARTMGSRQAAHDAIRMAAEALIDAQRCAIGAPDSATEAQTGVKARQDFAVEAEQALPQAIEMLRLLLEEAPTVPAPVEFRESVASLLRAGLAMEALEDALELVSEAGGTRAASQS